MRGRKVALGLLFALSGCQEAAVELSSGCGPGDTCMAMPRRCGCPVPINRKSQWLVSAAGELSLVCSTPTTPCPAQRDAACVEGRCRWIATP